MKIMGRVMQNVSLVISYVVALMYLIFPKYTNLLLLCAVLIWLSNIVYSLQYFRRRIIFFFFNITFFTFLLSRPIIEWIRGENWVLMAIENYYIGADARLSMIVIIVSLYALWLGAIAGNQYLLRLHKRLVDRHYIRNETFAEAIKQISLIVFSISLCTTFILGIEKCLFALGHSYVDYYTEYNSQFPYIIYAISTFMEYSLYIYLATLPNKRNAFIILAIYVLSTFPDLIIGMRGPIVKSVLFALIYYILRDFYGSKNKWIGFLEKLGLTIAGPLAIAFMGLYRYLRIGTSLGKWNFFSAIVDFFYRQGVTFSWLSSGLGAIDRLPNANHPRYVFGWIIDYFHYGKLGQLITGSTGLGSGNNILKATEGNSMAHHMSYILLGNKYLNGNGCGSSHLLEAFADGGFLGVFLFSLVLGFLLIVLVEFARRGIFAFVVVLCSIQGILIMPRSEAASGVSFLFRIPFWCVVCICFIGALLVTRKNQGLTCCSQNQSNNQKIPKNEF